MAKFTDATWHAVRNFTKDGQDDVLGLVVHIMQGTLEGSQSWFDNPAAQASSHFGTGKDGELRQWVDTKDRAWAQGNGNRTYLSVENEGKVPDSLTPAQIAAIAKLFYWIHKVYDVPLQLAHAPGEKGLGWHGMGGAVWGGHTGCPGDHIVAQLDDIVKAAKELAPKPKPPAPQKPPVPKPKPVYAPFPGQGFFRLGKEHILVKRMGEALVRAGYKAKYTPTEKFTQADLKAYAWWQRKQGYSGSEADGYPGKATWDRLHVAK